MAFCTNCGAKLEPGAKFCANCGTRVTAAVTPQSGDKDVVHASDAPGVVTLSTWEVTPEPKPKKAPSRPEGKAAPKKEGRKIGCWIFVLIFIVIPLVILLIGFFSSCSYTHTPPDPGTPFPAAHNGTFVCDRDTLWFNGDGKTVSWHFAQPLPELAAKGKGEYVFLFGHGKWRYDAAEKLRLIDTAHDNGSHTFLLAAPAADSLITLYVNKGAHIESATFRKAIL